MAYARTLIAKFKADTSGFDASLGRLEARLNSFKGVAGAAIAASGAALAAFAKSSFDAFSVQDTAERKLEQVIRATGSAAGFSAQQLKDYASELQGVTVVGDETILSAEAVLATFKNINGLQFKQAIEQALNLSTVLDTDLKSAALQLGKALNDPEAGLTSLSRAGVQFTDSQKDMISSMIDAGDIFAAQNIILAELEGQVGGTARAMRETSAGAIQAVKNQFGDLQEAFGGVITNLLGITDHTGKAETALKSMTNWVSTKLIPLIRDIQLAMTATIAKLQEIGKTAFLLSPIGAAKTLLVDRVNLLDAYYKILDEKNGIIEAAQQEHDDKLAYLQDEALKKVRNVQQERNAYLDQVNRRVALRDKLQAEAAAKRADKELALQKKLTADKLKVEQKYAAEVANFKQKLSEIDFGGFKVDQAGRQVREFSSQIGDEILRLGEQQQRVREDLQKREQDFYETRQQEQKIESLKSRDLTAIEIGSQEAFRLFNEQQKLAKGIDDEGLRLQRENNALAKQRTEALNKIKNIQAEITEVILLP